MSLLGEALSALRGRRRHDAVSAAPPAEPLDADQALVRAIVDGSQAAFRSWWRPTSAPARM